MGFKQTSEGRVFFKGPDNDDAPPPPARKSAAKEPVITSDQTQIQILLLLKSLNAKLKDTRESSTALKSQLAEYKKTIKELEEKTAAQESNYIDLEQKLSRKQTETNKKTSRVEQSIKESLKQIEEARRLVKVLEDKQAQREESIDSVKTELKSEIKSEIEQRRKEEQRLAERQKALEKLQKEQGEKMVNNVAAYVALTQRVSETEARQETLDNKIEEATAEFLKLDRKIDKALEDRVRMLRKIERIENAVMETRDALNAKAMVLLTSQGAIGGIEMPKIGDDLLQTDPVALNRRLQEEALMPWWRRPVRLQATNLVLLLIVVLLAGWIIGEMRLSSTQDFQTSTRLSALAPEPGELPRISLYEPPAQETNALVADPLPSPPSYAQSEDALDSAELNRSEEILAAPAYPETIVAHSEDDVYTPQAAQQGIRIHKGTMGNIDDSASVQAAGHIKTSSSAEIDTIDILNEEEMLAVLEKDPERLAARLNEIEPASTPPGTQATPAARIQDPVPPPPTRYDEAYKQALMARIRPDPNLPDVAKKIEEQAYNGVPEAQHDMGAIYVSGHGTIKKDMDRAVFWFEEAAKNGVANARYNLGVLHHQGIGVRQDINRAMDLYAQAADQGHPEAQYNLGIAYIEGIGVPYNPRKAAAYFENAANKGITEAAYNLGLIYENGLLGETRPDDALMWYKTAADKGSPEARSALEQLASSLGISLEDVKRIVERVQQSKTAQSVSGVSPASAADSNDIRKLVSEIQGELARRSLYSGAIDGMTGPRTSEAIRAFQRAANLDITGEPSHDLLKFLRASAPYSASTY